MEPFTDVEKQELKNKFSAGVPFSKEERDKILKWKILDLLEKSGGEMTVGELYDRLGVTKEKEIVIPPLTPWKDPAIPFGGLRRSGRGRL